MFCVASAVPFLLLSYALITIILPVKTSQGHLIKPWHFSNNCFWFKYFGHFSVKRSCTRNRLLTWRPYQTKKLGPNSIQYFVKSKVFIRFKVWSCTFCRLRTNQENTDKKKILKLYHRNSWVEYLYGNSLSHVCTMRKYK